MPILGSALTMGGLCGPVVIQNAVVVHGSHRSSTCFNAYGVWSSQGVCDALNEMAWAGSGIVVSFRGNARGTVRVVPLVSTVGAPQDEISCTSISDPIAMQMDCAKSNHRSCTICLAIPLNSEPTAFAKKKKRRRMKGQELT